MRKCCQQELLRIKEEQRIRVEVSLTYVEAIKETNTKRSVIVSPIARMTEQRQDQNSNKIRREYDRPTATKPSTGVDSVVYVAFLAEVVNCSA